MITKKKQIIIGSLLYLGNDFIFIFASSKITLPDIERNDLETGTNGFAASFIASKPAETPEPGSSPGEVREFCGAWPQEEVQ